jgi:hypothetical protein
MVRYGSRNVRKIHPGAHRVENNADAELGAYTTESGKETEVWSEELEHVDVLHTSQHELSNRELSTQNFCEIVLTSWGVITEEMSLAMPQRMTLPLIHLLVILESCEKQERFPNQTS